jgi:hypothetical protein
LDHDRRALSPSPEINLSSAELDDGDDDIAMPSTPTGSASIELPRFEVDRELSPALEKDEREFTQTADGLQKRKRDGERPAPDASKEMIEADASSREESWYNESKHLMVSGMGGPMFLYLSPVIRPNLHSSSGKREGEGESWLRIGRSADWDVPAEAIELEELDCLLDAC